MFSRAFSFQGWRCWQGGKLLANNLIRTSAVISCLEALHAGKRSVRLGTRTSVRSRACARTLGLDLVTCRHLKYLIALELQISFLRSLGQVHGIPGTAVAL